MSQSSQEDWRPGDELERRTETGEQEQIRKDRRSNGAKGDPTKPSGGSAYNTGGETQQVLLATWRG